MTLGHQPYEEVECNGRLDARAAGPGRAGDEVEIASNSRVSCALVRSGLRVGDDLEGVPDRTAGHRFRHRCSVEGRAQAGGVERDVVFEETALTGREAIDQAYQTKYARYGDTTSCPW